MRYAIYSMPAPDTALWHFGCAAIGYDAWRGETAPLLDHAAYRSTDAMDWTREPARYGFHGTLKAPFSLAGGTTEAALLDAARAFAASQSSFVLQRLAVKPLGRFLALVPAESSSQLSSLADECTRAFDRFRAPLSDADRRRRLAAPLTQRQIANLDAWGYPYVFEDFRFHMTLTGPLDDDVRGRLQDALSKLYETLCAPVPIDAIAVFKQEARDSRFRVIERFAFGS